MFSFKHKSGELIPCDKLMASLYINGDHTDLLKKVSKGDKAAFLQLVLLELPGIIYNAERSNSKKFSVTDLIDAAINDGVVRLIEEQSKILNTAGEVSPYWHCKMAEYIMDAIGKLRKNKKIKYNYKRIYTPKRIAFLSNLNRMLKQLEKQIVETAIIFLEQTNNSKLEPPINSDQCSVEVEILYYLRNCDDWCYAFGDSFNYKNTIIEKNYGSFLYDDGTPDPYCKDNMPELDDPYGYLLNDLMDYTRLGNKIFSIEKICVDINLEYRNILKLEKDGTGIMLHYDKTKGFIN